MNIKTSNRLAELRKQHLLSQEELAEKLGVSRQAVSKWERGESSPDTDNLIVLAEIYGMTIDEIIYGIKSENEQNADRNYRQEENRSVESQKNAKIVTLIHAAYTILATVAYLLLGYFLPNGSGWANYWFLFILIPVVGSTAEAILKKNPAAFNYPCFVTAAYCAVGMIAGIWHPTWAVFVTIPAFYAITGLIRRKTHKLDQN